MSVLENALAISLGLLGGFVLIATAIALMQWGARESKAEQRNRELREAAEDLQQAAKEQVAAMKRDLDALEVEGDDHH